MHICAYHTNLKAELVCMKCKKAFYTERLRSKHYMVCLVGSDMVLNVDTKEPRGGGGGGGKGRRGGGAQKV